VGVGNVIESDNQRFAVRAVFGKPPVEIDGSRRGGVCALSGIQGGSTGSISRPSSQFLGIYEPDFYPRSLRSALELFIARTFAG
jgi:hypothetical protein